jgi:23S rRNA pseudouridine2605 synthase
VRGEPVAAPEPARLWLYYKPEGLVTTDSDEKGRTTVFETLPPDMPRVMSVGRLDLNSEGLLLLTNDGELKRRLELPSTGWLRKYRVRVNGNPTDPDLEPLRKGIVVEGERFQPMSVVLDRIQGANAWLTIGLREGRNREIRRAMAAIDLTVNRLIRVSYGPFRLNEMKPGEVEEVRPKVMREQLGLTAEQSDAMVAAKSAAKPARPRAPVTRSSATGASETPGRTAKPGIAGAKPRPAGKPASGKPAAGKPAAGKPAVAPEGPRGRPGGRYIDGPNPGRPGPQGRPVPPRPRGGPRGG